MRSVAWVLFVVSGLYLTVVIVLGRFQDEQLPIVLTVWLLVAVAFSLMAWSTRGNMNR